MGRASRRNAGDQPGPGDDQGRPANAARAGLAHGASYYWQVRATNTGGTTYANGGSTAWWSFTIPSLPGPGAFNKSGPANGATNQPTNPTLSWGASSGATSYEYCIDTSNNNTCNASWISTGIATNIHLGNLLPNTSYYWQIHTRNAAGTTETNAGTWWSFTRNGIPAVPVTVSPDGTSIDTNPTYVWNESNGATSYRLIVYSASASATVIDKTVNGSSCSGGVCKYHPSVVLPVGNYEFKVSALTAADASAYSSWRSFKVVRGLFLPIIISSGG